MPYLLAQEERRGSQISKCKKYLEMLQERVSGERSVEATFLLNYPNTKLVANSSNISTFNWINIWKLRGEVPWNRSGFLMINSFRRDIPLPIGSSTAGSGQGLQCCPCLDSVRLPSVYVKMCATNCTAASQCAASHYFPRSLRQFSELSLKSAQIYCAGKLSFCTWKPYQLCPRIACQRSLEMF